VSQSTTDAMRDDHPEDEGEHTCAVCGVRVDLDNVNSTDGWRWFSDGAGGLFPLCQKCPVPQELHGT